MDTLTFINNLVWPLAVVITIITLKSPLGNLLSSITKIKYQGIEIDFGKRLADITTKLKITEDINTEKAREIAEVSPVSLISSSWSLLENNINDLIYKYTKADNRGSGMFTVDRDILEVINELRLLKNYATQSYNNKLKISANDAIEYYKLTIRTVRSLL